MRRAARFIVVLVTMLTIAIATMVVVGTIGASAKGVGGKGFGTTTTVSLGSQATLATSGLNVTVIYSCFPSAGGKGGYPGGGGFGSVSVTDLQGNQGFANWAATCNDTKQKAVVFVPGFFVAGAGAANAFVCGFECNGASREIKIA